MKIIDLDEAALNEKQILTKLDHENVVKYFDHFEIEMKGADGRGGRGSRGAGVNIKKLCIVTEFCEVLFTFIWFYNRSKI